MRMGTHNYAAADPLDHTARKLIPTSDSTSTTHRPRVA